MSPILIALIVGAALLVLVFLIVMFVLFRRYLAFRQRVKEMHDMKKDLMAWKNLNGLVRGGNAAHEAKAFLSSKIDQVRDLFAEGMRLLRTGGSARRPWFVVVGEPKSGKTSLFERSGLELRSGVSPETRHESPLVAWLGPRSFTLDVAGRVFFDRWMKGSGAEWNLLVRSIRRRNKRFPLDGIILTIPADALLTDDPALTREKASIIGNELQHLLKVTGLNVPCHVVITKLDLVLGFREYFFWLDEGEKAAAPFGWQNPTPGCEFDERAMTAWLDSLDARLRESMMARFLDPKIMRDPAAVRRVDTAGASVLFPDSLKSIRENLTIYMKRLFGKEAWNGHDQLLLSGVFFTAAEDAGVTISRDFAARCGKTPAEAKMTTESVHHPDGRFIGGLLNDFIFPCRVKASFTSGELFRRQLPGYILAAAIVALGVIWIFAALTERGVTREDLDHLTRYYRGVGKHLKADDYSASPLIDWRDGAAVLLKDDVVRGDQHSTRLTALCQGQMAADEFVRAPFGFLTSSMIWFDGNPDIGARKRRDVASILQTQMVFRPIFTALLARFKDTAESEPFTQRKRNVMFDFLTYNLHSSSDEGDVIDLRETLSYLFPEMPVELVNVLATYYKSEWNKDAGGLPERYCDPRLSAEICEKLVKAFVENWQKLEVYGETLYPTVRSLIRSTDEMRGLMDESLPLATAASEGKTNVVEAVNTWQEKLERVAALRTRIASDLGTLGTLTGEGAAEKVIRDKKVNVWLTTGPLTMAVNDYRNRLDADIEALHDVDERVRSLMRANGENSAFKTPENYASTKAKAEAALAAEEKELRVSLSHLSDSRLLEGMTVAVDPKNPKANASGIRQFEAVGKIADAALAVPSPKNPSDLKTFFDSLENLRKGEEVAAEKLKLVSSLGTNDHEVAVFANNVTTLMRLRARTIREQLIVSYAEFHPHNGIGLQEAVAALANSSDLFGISADLAAETFGDLKPTAAFDPAAAKLCFDVYAEMMTLAGGKNPIELPNKDIIMRAMGEYVDEYVAYWSNFADSRQVPCEDWAAYRRRAAALKPYEVNTLLAVLYRKSASIIGSIPKPCLDARQAKSVQDALATLEARCQMLTPHFSDVCIRQVTNWSLLNAEPTKAYRTLRESPAAVLVADYFAVDAAGAKGNVPWWTTFFDTGLDLVKSDARKLGFTQLKDSRAKFLRFPFCADPVATEVVKADELDEIKDLLESCGFAPAPESTVAKEGDKKGEGAAEKDDGANRIVQKVRTPYRADSRQPANDKKAAVDYFIWGERMHAIVETLRDRESETIWTLALTPFERSQELSDKMYPEMPIANFRYRYGELYVGDQQRGGRVALNSSTDVLIARGTIVDGDIKLKLDAYSSSAESTDVTLSFDGPWAILHLYLLPDGVYDAKEKLYDVPVRVRDRYNLTSVLWVRLKINRAIPKPCEWPTTDTWPDLPLK